MSDKPEWFWVNERELEILNGQTKEALIKMYLRGNTFRRRDMDIWDYVADQPSTKDEFWAGLREAEDPKEYVWECMQKK